MALGVVAVGGVISSPPATRVDVGASRGTVHHVVEGDTTRTTVRRVAASGRESVLEVVDRPPRPFSGTEVLALVRGVR